MPKTTVFYLHLLAAPGADTEAEADARRKAAKAKRRGV
jgi:hypothetical protein